MNAFSRSLKGSESCAWCHEREAIPGDEPERLCKECFDKGSYHAFDCSCGLCKIWRSLLPEEES